MTTRTLLKPVLASSLCALLSACISVNLGPKAPEKSKNVTFTRLPPIYRELKDVRADGAWRHAKNGNTISYLSTCNDPADPSLEVAAEEVVLAMGTPKNVSQKKLDFDGREALDTEAEARVEGVPTRIHALVFKKNACLYTLSLVGLAKSFAQGEADYAQFLKGFIAP